jgi:hypothetical protein
MYKASVSMGGTPIGTTSSSSSLEHQAEGDNPEITAVYESRDDCQVHRFAGAEERWTRKKGETKRRLHDVLDAMMAELEAKTKAA